MTCDLRFAKLHACDILWRTYVVLYCVVLRFHHTGWLLVLIGIIATVSHKWQAHPLFSRFQCDSSFKLKWKWKWTREYLDKNHATQTTHSSANIFNMHGPITRAYRSICLFGVRSNIVRFGALNTKYRNFKWKMQNSLDFQPVGDRMGKCSQRKFIWLICTVHSWIFIINSHNVLFGQNGSKWLATLSLRASRSSIRSASAVVYSINSQTFKLKMESHRVSMAPHQNNSSGATILHAMHLFVCVCVCLSGVVLFSSKQKKKQINCESKSCLSRYIRKFSFVVLNVVTCKANIKSSKMIHCGIFHFYYIHIKIHDIASIKEKLELNTLVDTKTIVHIVNTIHFNGELSFHKWWYHGLSRWSDDLPPLKIKHQYNHEFLHSAYIWYGI